MTLVYRKTARAAASAPQTDPTMLDTIRTLDDNVREAASSASGAAMTVRMIQGMMGEISGRNQKTRESVEQSHAVANDAAQQIDHAVQRVDELAKAVTQIGGLAELIQKIALQTKLLALNARIEAAHAGAIGAGFAVVANEVMELAASSAKASKDISQALGRLRTAQGEVVASITTARETYGEICNHVGRISGNVDEDRTVVETVNTFTADAASSMDRIAASLEQAAAVAAGAAASLSRGEAP